MNVGEDDCIEDIGGKPERKRPLEDQDVGE
jgi:hypothetical protein